MHTTPKGFRLHIGVFGRRNVGKSSLLNAMTRQQVSIVSDIAGTTTDPVEKPMELLPIGPVLFIDTAGIDDEGALGELRVARTRQIFDRTDVGLLVVGASADANHTQIPTTAEKTTRAVSRAWERDIQRSNARFNADLERYFRGEMTRGDALYLGVPGQWLRMAGLPDAPLLLHQKTLHDHLQKHSTIAGRHLVDLVCYVNQPVAVFRSHMVNDARVILLDVAVGQTHLTLAIHVKRAGQHSEIVSLHNRDSGWFENAATKGELLLADKVKGDWLLKLSERSCRSGSSNQPPSINTIVYSSSEVKCDEKNMATSWGQFEEDTLAELRSRKIPVIVVFNKTDLAAPPAELVERFEREKISVVRTMCGPRSTGADELREALIRNAPEDFINAPSILGDLVPPGELAMLVVPIDLEAPKGRLILPQVQTIRDLLDNGSFCMVAKESELPTALARLTRPPALVVTDSQGFGQVADETPRDIPLTSFSILFARNKGDLSEFVRGACAIAALKPGDRVLIAESCSHHPIGDDIGRVKIPRWLTQRVGGELEFQCVQGHDFPEDLSPFRLIVHCGGCMWNRREMLSRILRCRQAGVPITNYGLAIAWCLNIFERALEPFPVVREVYRQAMDALRSRGEP